MFNVHVEVQCIIIACTAVYVYKILASEQLASETTLGIQTRKRVNVGDMNMSRGLRKQLGYFLCSQFNNNSYLIKYSGKQNLGFNSKRIFCKT